MLSPFQSNLPAGKAQETVTDYRNMLLDKTITSAYNADVVALMLSYDRGNFTESSAWKRKLSSRKGEKWLER